MVNFAETKRDDSITQRQFFDTGRVVSVVPDSAASHGVVVRSERFESPIPCKVAVGVKGDGHLPTEGSQVLLEYRDDGAPTIVGYAYGEDGPPDFEEGERVIGHPHSNAQIRLKPDGSIHVESTNEVVINGGSKGAIYDLNVSKDADGHVTSITPLRRDTVLL